MRSMVEGALLRGLSNLDKDRSNTDPALAGGDRRYFLPAKMPAAW